MAVPKIEEIATPAATVEAVVAQAAAEPVKAVDVEKEVKSSPAAAVTSAEVIIPTANGAPKAEEVVKTEESAEASSSDQEQDTSEATPVEPSIPEWKEESNVVSDLKESEKKAVEEFKIRIQQAIKDGEFKVPKKVVKASKQQESAKAPEPVVAPTEEPKEEVAPGAAVETISETPAAVAEAPATPVTNSPAVVEEKSKEVSPAVAPVEVKAAETPTSTDSKVEHKAAVVPKVEAKAAPVVAEKTQAKAAPLVLKEVEAKAAPVVAEKVEVKDAPVAVQTVAAEEKLQKKADSEEVPVETTTDVEVAASQGAKAETAEAEAEEEPEDSTPLEDISLWGVPLLYTKGDKRTDVVLLKFLRAREFNVKEAFKQLRNTVIWRQTFKADNLLQEDFGTDLDGVAFMHGVSRDGQPVCYNVLAAFQDKELYQKAFGDAEKLNTFLRWRVQVLEKGIQLLSFSPEGPSAMVQITDLKNAPGPGKRDFRAAANQAVTLLQDNYPELSSKRVFINVPKYFTAMYAVVSPLLSKRTKSKFVGAPAGKTTECLLKIISADNIPVQYGGLSRTNDAEFTPGSAPVHELVLKGGKSTQIDIDVTEAGSTVVWDLSVIGFGVTYSAEFVPSTEGFYTIIIEKSKKLPSTTEEPVRNSFKATTPGKVVLTVGNLSRKKKTILSRYIVKGTSAAAAESS